MTTRRARASVALLAVLLVIALTACGSPQAYDASREALGTVVTVTAYGDDERAVRDAIDAAYDAMDATEQALDAYDETSDIHAINVDPYSVHELPDDALEILNATDSLNVNDAFSPTLLSVSRLYGFETFRMPPSPADLDTALRASKRLAFTGTASASFVPLDDDDPRLGPYGTLIPGLDFSGALKGLALDRARDVLRKAPAVSAAVLSAGSTTVTLGTKPDGSVWRVGVEDPRDNERVIAVFQFAGDGALSTSGDYQRFYEVGGVRYHHILDPATGLPAQGLRSLTVGGAGITGLESDILSTALFVMQSGRAVAYADAKGLGLYLVDESGQALTVPAPKDSGLIISEEAVPTP